MGESTPVEHVDRLASGDFQVEMPTYFSVGREPLHERARELLVDGSLAENLTFLGDSGRIVLSSGVRIACANGTDTPDSSLLGDEHVDVLFSSHWPRGIEKEADAPQVPPEEGQTDKLASALGRLRPKYLFAGVRDFSWERPPYRASEERVTRFLALADFGGSAKWFYAFNVSSSLSTPIPGGTTKNPFLARPLTVPALTTTPERPAAKRWDSGDVSQNANKRSQGDDWQNGRKRTKKEKRPIVGPDSCFFCLSNPNIDASLIAAIGNDCYVALAKGPLSSPPATSALGFSGHVLVIPIAHVPTFKALPEDTREASLVERRKFFIALGEMYKSQGLVPVYFEINRKSGVHSHTQVVPILADRAQHLVEEFKRESAQLGYPLEEREPGQKEFEYLNVNVDGTTLVANLSRQRRFDLQFCRRLLANFLGVPEEADWRQCVQSPDQEERDRDTFKSLFAPYDFT